MDGEARGVTIRPARDEDAGGLIALIGSVFDEYDGCVLDVDGEMPQLRRIASLYAELDGRFWVAEQEGVVVACVGVTADGRAATPAIPATLAAARAPASTSETAAWPGAEIHHLYVHNDARRAGLGDRLLALGEVEARRRGATWMELWSDTRFTDAHRFYLNRGYLLQPETRELHDLSHSVEHHFVKPKLSNLG